MREKKLCASRYKQLLVNIYRNNLKAIIIMQSSSSVCVLLFAVSMIIWTGKRHNSHTARTKESMISSLNNIKCMQYNAHRNRTISTQKWNSMIRVMCCRNRSCLFAFDVCHVNCCLFFVCVFKSIERRNGIETCNINIICHRTLDNWWWNIGWSEDRISW